MKKILLLVSMLFAFSVDNVKAKPINPNFDDDNFYRCVIDNLNEESINGISDRNATTYNISDIELASLPTLSCVSYDINSIKGIEKLTGITYVDFEGNNINKFDLSKNSKVVYLYIDPDVEVIGYDGVIEVGEEQSYEDNSSNNGFNVALIAVISIAIIFIISGLVFILIKKKTKPHFKNNIINLNREENIPNVKIQNKNFNFSNENNINFSAINKANNNLFNQNVNKYKTCPNCGNKLNSDANVCFMCGNKLN